MTWMRWHADGEESERLVSWQGLLRREMVEVDLQLPNPSEFRCVLNRMTLGDATFIRFRSTPHTVRRGLDRQDANGNSGQIMISAQLDGLTRVRAGDRAVDLRPGDIGLLDSGRPFINEFLGRTARAVVLIDRRRFSPPAAKIPLGRVPRDSPYFSVMRQHVLALANPQVNHRRDVAEALVQSLVLLVEDLPFAASARTDQVPRRVSKGDVDTYLRANILLAELSPLSIAAEFTISLRTLFAIYQQANESLEQAIIRIRLERAAAILCSEEFAGLSVTDVSTMVGFRDTSHFARRFRAAYGEPPTAWRARHR